MTYSRYCQEAKEFLISRKKLQSLITTELIWLIQTGNNDMGSTVMLKMWSLITSSSNNWELENEILGPYSRTTKTENVGMRLETMA